MMHNYQLLQHYNYYYAGSSGSVNYTDLDPGTYILKVEAMNGRDDRDVERRRIVIHDETECSVHLINGGITVTGDTAVVEFAATGSYTSVSCNLNNQGYSPCEWNCNLIYQ